MPLLKGNLPAAVSMGTFQKIQKRIEDAKKTDRVSRSEDFPCRGIVTCAACEKPLTGCWSTGKSKRYPYYLCKTRGCSFERKSIPREKLHTAVERLLTSIEPSPMAKDYFERFLRTAISNKYLNAKIMRDYLKKELTQLHKQEERVLDKIVDEDDPTTTRALKTRIQQIRMDGCEGGTARAY